MEEFASPPRSPCARWGLAGLLIVLAASGCTRPERSPEAVAPKGKPAASQAMEARAAEPPPAEVKPTAPPPAPPVAETPAPAPAPAPAAAETPAPAPPPKAGPPPAKPAPATAKAPAPAEAPKKAAPAKPSQPPLDLASLEQRLRDTEAIGFMTKLTLKNQVDELLGRFEAHYDGTRKASLAELRQPFDLLMMKVLSLLQDRDASLAGAIATSREAMWGILSDPAKFRSFLTQNRS